jgi:XTP/dITP diphosphohydrolase
MDSTVFRNCRYCYTLTCCKACYRHLKGEIIPEERGTNGFGYDPIFYIPETGRTMAELTLGEKNLLSHRAHAVLNAIPILKDVFGI